MKLKPEDCLMRVICQVLRERGGSIEEASQLLGMPPSLIKALCERYGIQVKDGEGKGQCPPLRNFLQKHA